MSDVVILLVQGQGLQGVDGTCGRQRRVRAVGGGHRGAASAGTRGGVRHVHGGGDVSQNTQCPLPLTRVIIIVAAVIIIMIGNVIVV